MAMKIWTVSFDMVSCGSVEIEAPTQDEACRILIEEVDANQFLTGDRAELLEDSVQAEESEDQTADGNNYVVKPKAGYENINDALRSAGYIGGKK